MLRSSIIVNLDSTCIVLKIKRKTMRVKNVDHMYGNGGMYGTKDGTWFEYVGRDVLKWEKVDLEDVPKEVLAEAAGASTKKKKPKKRKREIIVISSSENEDEETETEEETEEEEEKKSDCHKRR